ncbi:MAG: hypothetical protein K2U26_11170 [Cyclobacteriaceae bacterium]|nr:hypothetical protein [Cyclobacteriaceae bacterium]
MRLLILASFLMTLGLSAQAQDAPGYCDMAAILNADGQTTEWTLPWVGDSDGEFSYTICSDNNNLYIRVKSSKDYVMRKMALFGFTVWLDPSGKKKEKLGLKFPTGAESQERLDRFKNIPQENLSSGQRADFQKEVNRQLIENLEALELIGLADKPIGSTRSGIINGIKVGIGLNAEGAYEYEAVIPFKSYRLSKANIETLGVGFETGKFVMPKAKTQPGSSNPPGIGGSSNMGRDFGNRPYGNSQLTVPSSSWTTVKLK